MKESTIESLFNRAFNNARNFLTPTIIRYGETPSYIYELSSGPSIISDSKHIYGVTILTKTGTRPSTNLSAGGFASITDAESYISSLTQQES